jgi:hypothetical protein
VKSHHRVVWSDAEFEGELTDRYVVDHDAAQDPRVLGLELLRLHEHAPAVDPTIVGRCQFVLFYRQQRVTAFSELVEEHVADYATHPGSRSGRIAYLICALERANQGNLEHLLGVDPAAAPTTHDFKQLVPLCHEGPTDRLFGSDVGVDLRVHLLG